MCNQPIWSHLVPFACFVLCSGIAHIGHAQTDSAAGTARISGQITDRGSGAPVPSATVVLKDTSFAVLTDERGRYEINGVAPGKYQIQVLAQSINDSKPLTQQRKR